MQRIATCLMFVGDRYGKAEEAIRLYTSVFEDARVVRLERFGPDEDDDGIKHARFVLAGREFMAMDSGYAHEFTFTPAVSLFVEFDDPGRLDDAFAALSDGGAVLMPLDAYPFSTRFGWLEDRYGVSWQLSLA